MRATAAIAKADTILSGTALATLLTFAGACGARSAAGADPIDL
jgi:hypothetical protein